MIDNSQRYVQGGTELPLSQYGVCMRYWPIFLFVWVIFAVIATVTSAPIVLLFWKRVRWTAVDLLALIVPFIVWLLMMAAYAEGRKSLTNLAEPWLIALAVPVAILMRVVAGKRFSSSVGAWASVLLLSLVAGCVFWCTPAWRE